jgi:hypothetical protein
MRLLMRAADHELVTPTYTGLGERTHLAHPMINLETHIQDVRAVLEYEDWQDDVYLDAFVPSDGQSLNDLTGGQEASSIDGWLVPPRPMAPDTSPEDLSWATPRRRHQSVLCFTPVLHEATPVRPQSALLRGSAAPLSDDRLRPEAASGAVRNSGIPHAGFR